MIMDADDTPPDTVGDVLPDYGLIAPISVPADGRVPDAVTGTSSQEEYDRYFRLVRGQPELAQWSRSCLDVQRRVLGDLGGTELSAEDRYRILAGCLIVMHCTLEKWLSLGGTKVTT
jgi:hypothetical protein